MATRAIRAYWWNGGPGRGNFGDALTPVLCEYLSSRSVVHAEIASSELIATGSVLEPHFSPRVPWNQYRGCIWGAGRMYGSGVLELENSDVRAVRGRRTLDRIKCREPDRVALGDPGLLCSLLAGSVRKRYKLGVIPHLAERGHPWFAELARRSSEIVLIDVCAGVREVIERVSQCEYVLSSALHGLVLADALGIPNRWLRCTAVDERRAGKTPFKYDDYYSAFGLEDVRPLEVSPEEGLDGILSRFGEYDRPGLDEIQRGLLAAFPFPLRNLAVPSVYRASEMSSATGQNGQQRFLLGIGTGRCGTHTLAQVLSRQPDVRVTHEEPPLLPWRRPEGASLIRERIARWRRTRSEGLVGDVASFYLPYLEEALESEPELRVVCLKRPREEVVQSFCRWLDTVHPLPTNHWAADPGPGWHHEPVWTRIFPQYDVQDREEGLRRYWDEYHAGVDELVARYPGRIRVFDMQATFNSEAGQRELLSFAGIPPDKQVLVEAHTNRSERTKPHPRRGIAGMGDARDPRRCVVLVPYSSHIVPDCENALKELERRGYAVRRVRGYAAIDQGRNQMATDALVQGFEETMWIDADVGFEPNDIERLRSHGEPIVCGIYPQKGKRALACHVLPGTKQLVFGQGGGLHEILYAGTGFLLVRRQVYMDLQRRLNLPVCNERFGRPMIPYFQPLVRQSDDGAWYLAEDYSFCERARQCGYRVLADTTVRLWHVGQYSYSWEDAGLERQRFGTFTYHLT